MKKQYFLFFFIIAGWLVAACDEPAQESLWPDYDDPIWQSGGDGKDDSSATGVVKQIDWDGFVYVAQGADTATVQAAIRKQVKSALGALLHYPKLSLRDRDARTNLDTSSWKRDTLTVLGSDGQSQGSVDRVRYHYKDLALVPKNFTSTSLSLVLLFGDFVARASELTPKCSDDKSVEADSLWFHYDPGLTACKSAIAAENTAINAATAKLKDATQEIALADQNRRFLTVRPTLTKTTAVSTVYPEYDQLFGFTASRSKIVVYSFFGVDRSDQDPRDWGLVEDMRFMRTLRKQLPGLKVVETSPFAMLLDFSVDGKSLSNVTYENLAAWIVDNTGFPTEVGSDATKRAALQKQVRDKWLERWIVWQVPFTVSLGNTTRSMTLEIRTYYGNEDGRADYRQAARWRYLEAFWHGDVFSYTGHSHFGHGPLEPTGYSGANFPSRYQVLLFNSCVSYNYYDIDFLEMHPGGTALIDIVANGLPAYWPGMGEATAKYILGLVDGQNRSWVSILESMRVTVTGLPSGYEPMRAVTGEADNRFNPSKTGKISVTYGN